MRKLFTLTVCAVLGLALLVLPACQSTPKTVAFKTLKATADAVDGAMKAYTEAVVSGAVQEDVKVRELHGQFQAAFKRAVTAAHFDYATAAPEEVAALAADITGLIAGYLTKH